MKPLGALVLACALTSPLSAQVVASAPAPLIIGETFTIESRVLGETRRINVYRPAYADSSPLPVMYMPDGGMLEDFLHVAGLISVSTMNGTMRPFLLVGIENTQRRRDLTGSTENPEDRKIAPQVGGSAAFRNFIRDELMPTIEKRYGVTRERGIVGESLAGLFVVETFFLEPALFDSYIAIDPSIWWNNASLLHQAGARLAVLKDAKSLFLASSPQTEIGQLTTRLADTLKAQAPAVLRWEYQSFDGETHATIYHPAALRAFRQLYKPAPPAN